MFFDARCTAINIDMYKMQLFLYLDYKTDIKRTLKVIRVSLIEVNNLVRKWVRRLKYLFRLIMPYLPTAGNECEVNEK